MIICSCAVVSDSDLEAALVEILSLPDAPLPTPGVVFRHLEKKMVCCGCAPLAVATIYEKIDLLAKKGLACPYTCATAQTRLAKTVERSPEVHRRLAQPARRRGSAEGQPLLASATLEPA